MSPPRWWSELDPVTRSIRALFAAFLLGLAAAPWVAILGRVSDLEATDIEQTDHLKRLDARGKFNTCALLAVIQERDPNGCIYFLPDPKEYFPPQAVLR